MLHSDEGRELRELVRSTETKETVEGVKPRAQTIEPSGAELARMPEVIEALLKSEWPQI